MATPQFGWEHLRCPLTGQPLQLMMPQQLAEVNELIRQGRLYCQLGTAVQQPLEAGLVTVDRAWIYRIAAGIPQMVSGEAVRWQTGPETIPPDSPRT